MPLSDENRQKLRVFFAGHINEATVIEEAARRFPDWAQVTIAKEFAEFKREREQPANWEKTGPRFLTLREWNQTQTRLARLEAEVSELRKALNSLQSVTKEKSEQRLRFLPEFVQYDEGQLTFPYMVYFGEQLLKDPAVSIIRDHGANAKINLEKREISISSLGRFEILVEHLTHRLEKSLEILPIDPSTIAFVALKHAEDGVARQLDGHTQISRWNIKNCRGDDIEFPAEAYYRSGRQSIVIPQSFGEEREPYVLVLLVASKPSGPATLKILNASDLLTASQLNIPQGQKDTLISKLLIFKKKVDTITVDGPAVIGIGRSK